eukprot:SAG11_NODE_22632_length_402_cov_8.412541_1_plen_52_part_00
MILNLNLVHVQLKTRMAVPRYFEVPVDLPALDLYTNFRLKPGIIAQKKKSR